MPSPQQHSYWPAEWTEHQACFLLWPHNNDTFRLDAVFREFRQLLAALAVYEPVLLGVPDEATLREFDYDENVTAFVCPSNDTWARDTGPTVVVVENNRLVGLDWDFNAYGGPDEGCYWPCDLDRAIAGNVCRQLSIDRHHVPLVLEGGSIHTDGQGTLLTTQECLLHPNRSGKLQHELEEILQSQLGCTKTIWLPTGLAYDDDTNGHVDNWACFVRQGHVVLAWTDDAEHDGENYERCRQSWAVLEQETDASGNPLTIHKLLLPRPIFYTKEMVETLPVRKEGERMAASYVNFYIANGAVLVPQFGDIERDALAMATLAALFPDRIAVGIPSLEILMGGGNLHCITQQIPKLVL